MGSSISASLVNIPHTKRANNSADPAAGAHGSPSRAAGMDPGPPARTDAMQTVSEPEAVAQAAQQVRDFLQITRRDLEFSVDKESGRTIIRVLNAATGELVRQIPPDEVLAIAKRLDQPEGVLFRGHA